MKKYNFLIVISSIIIIFLCSCGKDQKTIVPSYNASKVPFAITLKGSPSEELDNKVTEYMDKTKLNYFIEIKNLKEFKKFIQESGVNSETYHAYFEKSGLRHLDSNFFNKNKLFCVFSYGNTEFIKIKEIKKIKIL